MTQRLGQKLVNYIRLKDGYKDGEALTWTEDEVVKYQAWIERRIFNMSDAEFVEALQS